MSCFTPKNWEDEPTHFDFGRAYCSNGLKPAPIVFGRWVLGVVDDLRRFVVECSEILEKDSIPIDHYFIASGFVHNRFSQQHFIICLGKIRFAFWRAYCVHTSCGWQKNRKHYTYTIKGWGCQCFERLSLGWYQQFFQQLPNRGPFNLWRKTTSKHQTSLVVVHYIIYRPSIFKNWMPKMMQILEAGNYFWETQHMHFFLPYGIFEVTWTFRDHKMYRKCRFLPLQHEFPVGPWMKLMFLSPPPYDLRIRRWSILNVTGLSWST